MMPSHGESSPEGKPGIFLCGPQVPETQRCSFSRSLSYFCKMQLIAAMPREGWSLWRDVFRDEANQLHRFINPFVITTH